MELVSASGELLWQRRTTLWGTYFPVPDDGAGPVDCPLRFPGQYADDETGLHYNLHRYYDPGTARYISADPLGLEPADHHHGYVRTPLTWIDPLGLSPCNYGTDDLYQAAATIKKGQLSPAGRALQKHGDPSPGNLAKRGQAHVDMYNFGKVTNSERTEIANEMIQDILTDPNVVEKVNTSASAQYGGITRDFRVPGGWGARWSWRGGQLTFEGFL
jgi:RHS repeat-associated protein